MSEPFHIELDYLKPTGAASLIEDLAFDLKQGQVRVLKGPSGSGKSSLLNWLSGTLSPAFEARGRILHAGRDLSQIPSEKRRFGLMLQQDHLFPHMNVSENILFGLRGGGTAQKREERVRRALQDADLTALHDRPIDTLSGGQRARVSLLRTLLSQPSLVLLDEPFARLDAALRPQIRDFTWRLCQGLPVLLVTHDEQDIPEQASFSSIGALQAHVTSSLSPVPADAHGPAQSRSLKRTL